MTVPSSAYRQHSRSGTRFVALLAFAAAALVLFAHIPNADACGCLSPPEPPPGATDFAVNQQSEQIIFEVPGNDTVTAHVLIKYAGDPEEFAWIVPVPSVPDLQISDSMLFSLLESATAPQINVGVSSVCPDPEYVCDYRDVPYCGDVQSASNGPFFDSFSSAADASTSPGGENAPGVTVVRREQVGSYDTVIFRADEADLAVGWLLNNGFIVNETMTPFMQPYVDANMLFVAAKLVAGAGIDAIRPLEMTYEGNNPMIPLQLTAVAAEPHLTVTSYIYGNTEYAPVDQPVATIDASDVAVDRNGRNNYPMLLAKAADDVGGDGFVVEYSDTASNARIVDDPSGCCSGAGFCFPFDNDGVCQCPGYGTDVDDCSTIEGLTEAVTTLTELAETYPHLTRISTRLSAEEMTFDPMFEETSSQTVFGRLSLFNTQLSLSFCEADIIDTADYYDIELSRACSSVYCGPGTCAVSADGRAGCACDAGYTARTFTDLDGKLSVTCTPDAPIVDYGLEIDVPDACAGIDCGAGSCVDVGGVASCECDADHVGVLHLDGRVRAPQCEPIVINTATGGATDYTLALNNVRVCAPAPPSSCGQHGWLVPNQNISRKGVVCPSSVPTNAALLEPKSDLVCVDQSGTGSTSTLAMDPETGEIYQYGDLIDPTDPEFASEFSVSGGGGDDEGSCDCRAVNTGSSAPAHGALAGLAALLGLVGLRRRRR